MDSDYDINASRIKLLKMIPIESFSWGSSGRKLLNRQSIVQFVVGFLNVAISIYNALFRGSQTILTCCSIAVFFAVHSILPFVSFGLCIASLSYISELSPPELYERALENIALFVSFAMGLLALFATEIVMVMLASNGSGSIFTDLEAWLMVQINNGYSTFITGARRVVVEQYRETGWGVLELMVKQQNESRETVRETLDDEGLPTALIDLLEEFVVDPELEVLLRSRHLLDETETDTENADSLSETEREELRQKASNLRPFQIFEMYALDGTN